MSERTCVLDELVFRPCSVESLSAWTVRKAPRTVVALGSAARDKVLKLPVPFFSRQPNVRPHEHGWREYCGLLRKFGIPVYATVAAFESLPAANTPSRFGVRYSDYPVDELEVTTADAFEVVCHRGNSEGLADSPSTELAVDCSQWPLEIRDAKHLASLVSFLKELSGGDTPIGICLPFSDSGDDIEIALGCGFDFLTLSETGSNVSQTSSQLDFIAYSVAKVRKIARQIGQGGFPVLVDASIDSRERLIRLIALGASAVGIDGLVETLVAESLQASSTVTHGKGMLSDIAEPIAKSRIDFSEVESELQLLVRELRATLARCDCESLTSFNSSCLAAIDPRATRLTGVALLEQ